MEFVSVKGKVYDERTVLPVVMSLLARQMRFAKDGSWREAVRRKMRDVEWLRFRAGMCPTGLAEELFTTAIVAWHESAKSEKEQED